MPSLVLATRLIRPFTVMFLDPCASRFCIFRMPVPDNDIQYVHCLFFIPAHSAVLPLCDSKFKHMGCNGCVACYSPTAALSICLLIA